jgi:hypothetical protein
MTAAQATTAAAELAALREEFDGQWHIWRSRWNGEPAGWYATLRHPAFGVDPTVGRDTAEDLRAALLEQRDRAEQRRGVRIGTFEFPPGA